MREIPLTGGFVALVDDEDYARVSDKKWSVFRDGGTRAYAVHARQGGTIYMHRVIMGAGDGDMVDHRRHRGDEFIVDNRRENLRFATGSQNSANRIEGRDTRSSIFRGVGATPEGRWRAGIQLSRKRMHLGNFLVEAHAAMAYDIAAVALYGEYATTNFPVPGSGRWLYGSEG